MKRYTFESRKWWVMPVEHPKGEWVKWEDVDMYIEYWASCVADEKREDKQCDGCYDPDCNHWDCTPSKVFCSDCKHFSMYRFGMAHACVHSDNLKDSWEGQKYIAIATPQERNKNNDCPLFERKGE